MATKVVQNNNFSKRNAEKLQEKILPKVMQILYLGQHNVSYFLIFKKSNTL
ncbi:MAG: hypothetical protein RLZZ292_3975 [Bacteroidota bacterium]|jgi:hypothetical protein